MGERTLPGAGCVQETVRSESLWVLVTFTLSSRYCLLLAPELPSPLLSLLPTEYHGPDQDQDQFGGFTRVCCCCCCCCNHGLASCSLWQDLPTLKALTDTLKSSRNPFDACTNIQNVLMRSGRILLYLRLCLSLVRRF